MSHWPEDQQIEIIWEHIEDQDADPLFQQAVKLILAEINRDPTADHIDKPADSNHPEGVPSRTNKSKQVEQ